MNNDLNKEIKIIFKWNSKNILSNLTIGATYSNSELETLKKWEYKTPEHWSVDKVITAVKHNIYTDLIRYKLDRYTKIAKYRYLDTKEYLLQDLKEIWQENKKLVVASFIAVSSVPLFAAFVAQDSSKTFPTVKQTVTAQVDTISLGLNDDVIQKIFENDIIVEKAKNVDSDGIPIKKGKETVKHKVGDVVEIFYVDKKTKKVKETKEVEETDPSGYWKTIANDVKSGTYVGDFKNSKFKVSKKEQDRRIKLVYNFFKNKEDDFQINALIATSQFIIESDCGQSNISNLGNNYFGLKCFRNDVPYIRAIDDNKDVDETGKSRFRKYSDVESGLLGYCEFIGKNLYKEARENYKNPDKYLYCLQHLAWDKENNCWVAYATEPKYMSMIKSRIKRIKEVIKN